MAKPSKIPFWTDGDAAKIDEPSTAKTALGFVSNEKPSPFNWNWLQHFNGLWIEYLDEQIEAVKVVQGIYDAVVGVGGTHATINDVMADTEIQGLGRPPRIFVKSPFTATITQDIDIEGSELEFGPGAEFSKGGSLGVGINISADRVRLRNARFLNFDETGGAAIKLDAVDKCFITGCSFNNVTKGVDESTAASENNVISGNLFE